MKRRWIKRKNVWEKGRINIKNETKIRKKEERVRGRKYKWQEWTGGKIKGRKVKGYEEEYKKRK